MKILLSAFACAPGQGSEPGTGWNWAVEAARLGHQVHVLTQICDREAIERAVAAGSVPPGLTFEFVMPRWLEWLRRSGLRTGRASLTMHSVHLLWQFAALWHVRRRCRPEAFDVVHHITYGGIRHPTLLGRLGIPLVLGPVGGGERAPLALRRDYSWGGWLFDLVRDFHTWSLRFDPITRRACADALVIYLKSPDTRRAVPPRYRHKAVVHSEIGTRTVSASPRAPRDADAPFRLLYAGRLLWWKGLHLGIRAVAEARSRGVDARLTVAGTGSAERGLRKLSASLGVAEAVEWRGWIAQDRLMELYRTHDALLFPSLHDSGGNVIIEAMCNGLPVVCLKIGGPGAIVAESCKAVPVEGRSSRECVSALADAIAELARHPERLPVMSESARAFARELAWPKVVGDLYEDVQRRLQQRRLRGGEQAGGHPAPALAMPTAAAAADDG